MSQLGNRGIFMSHSLHCFAVEIEKGMVFFFFRKSQPSMTVWEAPLTTSNSCCHTCFPNMLPIVNLTERAESESSKTLIRPNEAGCESLFASINSGVSLWGL